jgi:DNA-binding MarR family transcriptional regulator
MSSSRSPNSGSGSNDNVVADEKSLWLRATRWRNAVETDLADIAMTFTQWLVLDTLDELIRETGDAVNQSAIATRTQLDRTTVSQVMRSHDDRGFISREPGFGRLNYRIWLTTEGENAVIVGRACVKAASIRLRLSNTRNPNPINDSTSD